MAKANQSSSLWEGITDSDFYNEMRIEDVDLSEFEQRHMINFFANVNYFRQLTRLSDSLKPVERRYLYVMYKNGYRPGRKVKANVITGKTMEYHAHADTAIYGAIISSSQQWNTPIPLIDIKSNKGNISAPDEFAQSRYMDIMMSQYAWECFFADYDDDCVEVLQNSAKDDYEPMSLPAKFPNILVNGGFGLAPANTFRVPPFNINDIIKNCIKVLRNPDTTEVFMVPDLPTGCQIIDDGENLRNIVEHGEGNLRMRADIDIVEGANAWYLCVKNVPWMVSMQTIHEQLVNLGRNKKLPIEELSDHSAPIRFKDGRVETVIDYRIKINKAHDPYDIRNRIYKATRLDVTVSVQFKAVTDDLKVELMSMKELIQAWINERRSYKRRLYNKKLSKIMARLELLEILLYLTRSDNLSKTMKLIQSTNESDLVDALVKHGHMNSFQAAKVIDMGSRVYSKDAPARYREEKEKLEAQQKSIMEILKSETRIDAIIEEELTDLKKYALPRKSSIVTLDGAMHISDTTHNLIVTKQGYIKKLMHYPNDKRKDSQLGSFRPSDYPINRIKARNLERVMILDSYGRYSIIPVHEITNNELSEPGTKIFDIAKLNGSIVRVMSETTSDMLEVLTKKWGIPYLVTLTANGYLKRTLLTEFMDTKTVKNGRAMKVRADDHMVYAGIHLGNTKILIYTKKGKFITMSTEELEPAAKDTMGLLAMRVEADDECVGISIISADDQYLAMITNKGLAKKVELSSLGETKKRLQSSSYLITLDQNDTLYWVDTITEKTKIFVCTRGEISEYYSENLPTHTRKAKGVKLVPLRVGDNIISVETIRHLLH